MHKDKNTPGEYALFLADSKKREMDEKASFYDQDTFAISQLERALDLRNCGLPIAGMGLQERVKYYFFRNFRPFWVK
jgi:hypothetical protein